MSDKDAFVRDYTELVNQFANLPSQPKIYLMVPPPIYLRNIATLNKPLFTESSGEVINGLFPTLIPMIAREKLNLPED